MLPERHPTRRGRPPWYTEGIRFSCTRCGQCCRNRGGYEVVWITPGERERLAGYLGITTGAFRARHLVYLDGDWSLASRDQACTLLDDQGHCTAYPVRPRQCRTWPFWPGNLQRTSWETEVVALCPGVGQGRRYSLEEVRLVARAAERRIPVPELPVSGGSRRASPEAEPAQPEGASPPAASRRSPRARILR